MSADVTAVTERPVLSSEGEGRRDQQHSIQPDQADPFLFPSETTFRFLALIAAMIGAFSFVAAWLFMTLPWGQHLMQVEFKGCMKLALGTPGLSGQVTWDRAKPCLAAFNDAEIRFVGAGLVAAVGIVVLIHLIRPALTIRLQRLKPLYGEADPALLPPLKAALEALVAEAMIRRPPIFLLRISRNAEAFTLGNWFRDYIVLDAGLVGRFHSQPDMFRAVLRHELAHFRNKDIGKTGLTTASWWLFVATTASVLLYWILVKPGSPGEIGSLLSRFGVAAVTVFLMRQAFVRAREFYADARAFGWDGASGALARTLQTRADGEASDRWRMGWPGGRWLRWHPSASDRIAALRQPDRMLRTTILGPGLTGLAIGIGYPPSAFFAGFLTDDLETGLGGRIVSCLFLLPLVGSATVSVWRQARQSAAARLPDLKTCAFGLSAAIGILLGMQVSFMGFIAGGNDMTHPGPLGSVLVLVAFYLWSRAGAVSWLSSGVRRRDLVVAWWVGLALGYFVLVTVWSELSGIQALYQMWDSGIAGSFVAATLQLLSIALAQHKTTALVFAALWLYLVIPRLVSLSPAARHTILRTRLRQILMATLVFTVLIVAFRLALREWVPQEVRDTDEFKIWTFYRCVEFAAVMQGVLAFTLVMRSPKGTFGEAGLCSLVAGLLMSIAFVTQNIAFGGGHQLSFVVMVANLFVNLGAVVAAAAAFGGCLLRFLLNGFRPTPAVTAPIPSARAA